MKKWLIRSVASMALLFIVGFLIFYGVSICQRHRAQSFLEELASLKLGISSFSDAQRLAQKYGGQPWDVPLRAPVYSAQYCSFRFVFENKILNHIQNEREISLAAALTVKDGYVVSREVDYAILGPVLWSDHFVYELSDHLSPPHSLQSYNVTRLKLDAQGTPHWVKVDLSPDAPEDLRSRAYSLDLECLASLHGCDDLSAVLPKGL
jgi:hypothetical protein